MPDQLTPARARGWRTGLPALHQASLTIGLLGLSGVVAGLVWEWLWTPPTGVVVGQRWFLDEQGLRDDFSGTGSYVAVALLVGLLVGAAIAVRLDHAELVTLAAVVVGSGLAAWVMYRVGVMAGPPDPAPLAETVKDGTALPARLRVGGWSPFVAFPGGALLGLLMVYFGLARRQRTHAPA